jgi:hypothetical protein
MLELEKQLVDGAAILFESGGATVEGTGSEGAA